IEAKDGRGTLLEKTGGQLTSNMNERDLIYFEQILPKLQPKATAAGELIPAISVAPVTLLSEEYNPYDDSQLEALVLTGRRFQEAGSHADAAQVFDMAWQSSRVANGLYHASQVPLLESMIISEIELEDWQAVDDHYAYVELLLHRLYDKQDSRLEAGLQAVSSWHVNAFNLNLDGKREQHLRKAYKVLKLRLEVAENTLPADDPKFEFLHESIRLSETYLYLMSERYKQQLRNQERAERERLLATLD
ncbi:MAG: hypothetical protein AAF412_15040, partial [Pseudomonadota bacterium]